MAKPPTVKVELKLSEVEPVRRIIATAKALVVALKNGIEFAEELDALEAALEVIKTQPEEVDP